MTIEPLGDSALIVRITNVIEPDAAKTIRDVMNIVERIRAVALPGIVDVAPAYTSIGIFYDPDAGDYESFRMVIESVLSAAAPPAARTDGGISHEIPVCYDSDFAPDIARVAEHTKLTADIIFERHCAGEYHVHCVGFTPGFPYLGGLPAELVTPRLSSPRTKVPAGSVAIGGAQTGIYPQAAPGGWNIIGRTPIKLFDVTAERPALLSAGDRVRFRRITRDEYKGLS